MKHKHRGKLRTWRLKALSLVVASALYSGSLYAQDTAFAVNLPAQALQSSVERIAEQGNVHIIYVSEVLQNKKAPALSGQYTVDQALQQLLQGTNLTVQKNGNVWSIVESVAVANKPLEQQTSIEEAVQLAPLTVYGEKDRDTQGYDDVYEKNYSTVYAGKDLIERFKGTTPSDLFKGMSNVYSGDARNSGAIDPNIRGVQGQGRVPVTIDGTEQALTVWRGYNGVNNRNYIDPNLLSSIQVVKGAGLDRSIKTGIGGGVAATTLQVDDIVRPGEKYGAEIKVEGGTNSIKERETGSYAGQDYRDVFDSLGIYSTTNVYVDPLSQVTPKTSDDNKLSNWDDKAIRIAVATKQEDFDLLAAYAYRSRGNYFAGKKGSGDYTLNDGSTLSSYNFNFTPYMATTYKPGAEVTNTSNTMESYLLKGTWRPTDDQALQFTYRDSKTTYGEIMPSRISWWSIYLDDKLPQWPLSEVETKAYSLEYKYNPEDIPWINFKANLWQTDTDSQTYSSGGFVNFYQRDNVYTYCNPDTSTLTDRQITSYATLCTYYTNIYGTDRDTTKSYLIVDTAYSVAKNTKKGANLSNQFTLRDNLNLTLGGDFTYEKLSTEDEYYNDTYGGLGYRMLPRAGRRAENQYWFNFDWQPKSWLLLTAGAKSTSYWSFDDYLNESSGGTTSYTKVSAKKITVKYNATYTQQDYESDITALATSNPNASESFYNTWDTYYASQIGTTVTKDGTYYWYADPTTGKYSASTNPLLNGTVDISSLKEDITSVTYIDVTETATEQVKKKKDHKNWAPAFSATFQINPNNRFYINYSEAYRLPSLFETTLGFSASQSGYDVEPEHAYNWELAYVYNLKDRLKLDKGQADIKLAYFRNKTENVIERDTSLVFTNVDQQKISGFELSGRYDNGRYFGDLSLVWNKQNQVCDESLALTTSPTTAVYGADSYCMDYGFPSGYLINMVLPEYQANLTLGTRLFNDKLEIGNRLTYFSKYKPAENTGTYTGSTYYNVPIAWMNTLILDAYASYKYNEHFGIDFTGTNLTNRYYVDPLTRSPLPAPGRTFKLALTYNF